MVVVGDASASKEKSGNHTVKKKLLIYAHYYVPDVASTGQLLRELAEGMLDTFDITVICVVPSYAGRIAPEYKTQKVYKEEINGVKVHRIRVPEFGKGDKQSRVKNILAYYFGAITETFRVGKQDFVFSISQPPILGGLLGVWGKWIKGAKFIYNIQDFNPEQTMAVGYVGNKVLLGIMMWFDMFVCRHSNLVITVGRDLVETLIKRFQGRNVPNYVLIHNWVNEKEIYMLPSDNKKVVEFKCKYGMENKFIIMYSGNIGLYYDLLNILKVIRRFKPGTKTSDGREVLFAFVGAGAVLEKMLSYKEEHHMDNVVFIPYQVKEDFIYSLNAGDVHWVVNARGIKGVSCPSKFYGVAAGARPVLGVLETGSEIRYLIEETGCGLVCEPGDYTAIEKNIQWFLDHTAGDEIKTMGLNGRKYLLKNLTRDVSVEKYKREILKLS